MKKIGELFGQAILENSSINDLVVTEMKFSKKANSAIITVDIDRKVIPLDLFKFSENAKNVFKLKSFKVIPKTSVKQEVGISEVQMLIELVGEISPYTKDLFKDSVITLGETIDIELKVPSASFLKLKKVDEYIESLCLKFYGKEIEVNIYDSLNAKQDFVKRQEKEEVEYKKTLLNVQAQTKNSETPKQQVEGAKSDSSFVKDNSKLPEGVILDVE